MPQSRGAGRQFPSVRPPPLEPAPSPWCGLPRVRRAPVRRSRRRRIPRLRYVWPRVSDACSLRRMSRAPSSAGCWDRGSFVVSAVSMRARRSDQSEPSSARRPCHPSKPHGYCEGRGTGNRLRCERRGAARSLGVLPCQPTAPRCAQSSPTAEAFTPILGRWTCRRRSSSWCCSSPSPVSPSCSSAANSCLVRATAVSRPRVVGGRHNRLVVGRGRVKR
jgi:hypothetical protein